jgi:hypothetical protein
MKFAIENTMTSPARAAFRTVGRSGKTVVRTLALACAALVMVAPAAQAQGHGGFGHHGGGWGGRGLLWGGVGLGLGLGLGSYYYGAPYYAYPAYPAYSAYPGYVVAEPPIVYSDTQPVQVAPVPAQQVPQYSSSEPVIYPRNGQSAAKTESDHEQCSAWAGSQRGATTDPSVFNRGVAACLDARGYTVR